VWGGAGKLRAGHDRHQQVADAGVALDHLDDSLVGFFVEVAVNQLPGDTPQQTAASVRTDKGDATVSAARWVAEVIAQRLSIMSYELSGRLRWEEVGEWVLGIGSLAG